MKNNVWVWVLSALILSGCLRTADDTGATNGISVTETAQVTSELEDETENTESRAEQVPTVIEIEIPWEQETDTEKQEQTVKETDTEEWEQPVKDTEKQSEEETTELFEEEQTENTDENSKETENAEQQVGEGPVKTFTLGKTLDERVSQVNTRTINTPESGVVDLFSMQFSAEMVRAQIEQYTFLECAYIDGRELTNEDRTRIEENRNLSALYQGNDLKVTYGILAENAAVRSFPTEERLTKTVEDLEKSFDYFQESLLFVGEPVALLHTSLDGVYTFVQGMNYCGWVKTACIRTCDMKLAQAVSACADFVVVTERFCDISGRDDERIVRMGTVLPLLGETGEYYIVPVFCDEQVADGCFVLLDGTLQYYRAGQAPEQLSALWVKEATLPKDCANAGYLEYSQDNILSLADRMAGSVYSWGDEAAGYDCSSTIGSIYRCFGIILPRNSGALKYTGANFTDLTGMTADEKRAYITSLPAGTILVLPGHAMMYLGVQSISVSEQKQNTPAMLHCVTGYVDVDGVTKEPYACVKTSIDIRSRGVESYLDLMTVCVSFPG